ncbi:MAG: hypothetical protein ACTSRW_00305 [Candidatus Helarchaeota archaeon]
MKNYFGLTMFLWIVSFVLAILFTWSFIIQNYILSPFILPDKRFLMSVLIVLFAPFNNIFVCTIWFITGLAGGILIRGLKSSIYLSVFAVSVLYSMFAGLFLQLLPTIFTISYILMNLSSFLTVLAVTVLGGCLGGLIRPDPKPSTIQIGKKKVSILSKCPSCGREYDSKPLLCCFCGTEMSEEKTDYLET